MLPKIMLSNIQPTANYFTLLGFSVQIWKIQKLSNFWIDLSPNTPKWIKISPPSQQICFAFPMGSCLTVECPLGAVGGTSAVVFT